MSKTATTPSVHFRRALVRSAVGGFTAVAVGLAGSPVALADDGSSDTHVSAAETLAALKDTSGVLAASDRVSARSDSDSAVMTSVLGSRVDVPRDAEDGVSVRRSDGTSFTVTPPQEGDTDGTRIASGVVAFPGEDGSSTAVQATENGGLRMLTVISDRGAPEDYTYDVDLPAGGSVKVNPDGTASLLDETGTAISVVQEPWAEDADGVAVPTYYTTDGRSLTQHIAHQGGNYALPIKADPWFWSYVSCITGIGIPAGLAIYLAATLGTMATIRAIWAGRGPSGGPAGSALAWYATRVYQSCRAFINS